MKEYEEKLNHLKTRFETIKSKTNYEGLKAELAPLEEQSMNPDLWKDQDSAQKLMSKLGNLKNEIQEMDRLEEKIQGVIDFLQLIDLETNLDEKLKAEKDLEEEVAQLEIEIDSTETKLYLGGKYDKNNAIITIHAGQGGTEACDWAEMMMRMYLRYFERKGWSAEVTHMVQGTEAGISSVTIEVEALYAYGLLKREHGAHRLVRVSPFNAQGLRQTSFAGVEAMPIIDDDDNEIVIKPEDIEFKAVRAGGPGGQKVNKTSSAVQIRHLPTGIQVFSSERKSQHQNRDSAMRLLRARLFALEEERRAKEIGGIQGEHKVAAWGNQIRNYVLHPYKLVKDLRTDIETNNTEAVLDGDLYRFIDAGVRL
jgi:peptide chain release factor 2